jgi:hypothetical protein
MIHFLWRPFLAHADDDMVLELAFASGADHVVTHNKNDFRGAEQLGVTAIKYRANVMSKLTIELPDSVKENIEALAAKEIFM